MRHETQLEPGTADGRSGGDDIEKDPFLTVIRERFGA